MQPMLQDSTRMQTMPVTCLVMPPARAMHVAPHHMAGRKGMSEAPSVTSPLWQTQDWPVQKNNIEDHACAKECCAEVEEGCRQRRQSGMKYFASRGMYRGGS